MANEVEKAGVFGGRVAMANVDALKDAMQQSAQNDPRGSAPDGSDYMSFSGKRGVYEIGTEKRDTSPDELWVVNVPSFQDGWVCWKSNNPVATRMVGLGQPLPTVDMNEHGPFKDGEGWKQAKAMTIYSIDNSQQCYFTITSVSGVSTFAGLQKEVVARLMAGQPYWPVVAFGRESFTAKGYKNFKPTITVDGWLSDDQMINQLPALFADEDAELDLERLYAEAAGGMLPHDGEEDDEAEEVAPPPPAKQVAKRNRRSA